MLELDPPHANAVLSPPMVGGKLPNRIEHVRVARGLTQQQLADAVIPTTSQAQIDRLEKGTRQLTQKWLERLGRALGVPATDLLPVSSGQQPASPSVNQGEVASNMRSLPDAPPMFTSKRDLPILGHTKAGEGFFIDNGVVSGMEYRPVDLMGVADAYAVEVHGTSMEPRLEQGYVLYVNPRKALRAGKDVVVQCHDGRALIKTLVRANDSEVILREYNPRTREIKLKRSEIEKIHLVVGIRP